MLLESINSPQDLKKIPIAQLPVLAGEIRALIIDIVSKAGGHLASSLGVVELSIALHYCFNAPEDIIVWDVGHQCYTHKILTGRRKEFSTLRQFKGISGFPLREESPYDMFSVGHASTAISLALGFAVARDLKKEQKKIVAVIGDGSLSGGMCFEALNNVGHLNTDILIILNTNEMSISPVVGALSNYMNKIISAPIYNRYKTALKQFIAQRVPRIGRRLVKLAIHFEEVLKGLIVPGIFFEELGFRYFGPLDGHNLTKLIETINNLKSIKGPRLLHITTKKGKGYAPAEKEPEKFHGVAKFSQDVLEPQVLSDKKTPSFTEIFSNKLIELGEEDNSIVAITAAMPEGTGLDKFAKKFPGRFFDVGIAEEHAVAFACGLASNGLKPVVAIYSTFLQRSYDQLMIDLALQNFNVVIAIDRAGIVGADGVTHQGIFDIAFLRTIPNMIILAPKDAKELEACLEFSFKQNCPVAIRYPKANIFEFPKGYESDQNVLKPQTLKSVKEISLIALGSMVKEAFQASEVLEKQGIEVGLINARCAKPLDEAFYKNIGAKCKYIFAIEEGILDGGFGNALRCLIDAKTIVKTLGLPTEFIQHGQREFLLDMYGLSPQKIAEVVKTTLSKK
ncbi:MAG: 1-deoxy-D-xylulose-5-phosphate synthase [Candidatus Omnitrophota bacterium]